MMRVSFFLVLFSLFLQLSKSRPSYCSLFKCPTPPLCCKSGQYTTDSRLCCMTCASGEQETCGGAKGAKCAKGLRCLKTCEACQTLGPERKPCVFPFRYFGTTYNKCTSRDSEFGRLWCATKVDPVDNHVVDHEWGDCDEGCPGTGVECNEQYFKAKEGICVDLSIPGSIPYGKNAPKTQLMPETKEIFEAPLCEKSEDKIMKKSSCGCDVGSTSVKLDDKGRHRGNCSGVPFHTLEHRSEYWCFLKNVKDPLNPSTNCYQDAKWSYKDGRFWSYEACADVKVIDFERHERRNHLNDIKLPAPNTITKPLPKKIYDNDNKRQISSNGKACVFPFMYDNKIFNSCTSVDSDDGKEWCATGVDADGHVIDHDWGDCVYEKHYSHEESKPERKKNIKITKNHKYDVREKPEILSGNNVDQASFQPSLDPKSSTQGKVVTTDGKECTFPFTYEEETFTDCTVKDSENGAPWCAIETDDNGYMIDNKWGFCALNVMKVINISDTKESYAKEEEEETKGSQVKGTREKPKFNVETKIENQVNSQNITEVVKKTEIEYKQTPTLPIILEDVILMKDNHHPDTDVISDNVYIDNQIDMLGKLTASASSEGKDTNKLFSDSNVIDIKSPKSGLAEEFSMTDKNIQQTTLKNDIKEQSPTMKEDQPFVEYDNTPEEKLSKISERSKESTVEEEEELVLISSNGKECIFSFRYGDTSYNECTDVDSETGVPWCATGIDEDGYVLADDWGYCTELRNHIESTLKDEEEQVITEEVDHLILSVLEDIETVEGTTTPERKCTSKSNEIMLKDEETKKEDKTKISIIDEETKKEDKTKISIVDSTRKPEKVEVIPNHLPLKVARPEELLGKPKQVKPINDLLKNIIQAGTGTLGLNLWKTDETEQKRRPRPVYKPKEKVN